MKKIAALKDSFALQVVEDIRREISSSLGKELKEIILYGSYARDEQTHDSDVDIVVLLDGEISDMPAVRRKLSDIKVDLSLKYDVVISIIIKTYTQYLRNRNFVPFYSNIYNEGVEIYGG